MIGCVGTPTGDLQAQTEIEDSAPPACRSTGKNWRTKARPSNRRIQRAPVVEPGCFQVGHRTRQTPSAESETGIRPRTYPKILISDRSIGGPDTVFGLVLRLVASNVAQASPTREAAAVGLPTFAFPSPAKAKENRQKWRFSPYSKKTMQRSAASLPIIPTAPSRKTLTAIRATL